MTDEPDNKNRVDPSLTIVGGQPGKRPPKRTVQVPVGIEQLLFLAARDEPFKERLLRDRHQALAESKIALRPSEEAVLKTVSDKTLLAMIRSVVPENPRRRKFMGAVAAAAASLAAGTVVSACDLDTGPGPEPTGITPDDDDDDDSSQDDDDSGEETDSETESDTDTDSDTDTEGDG